MTSRRLLACVLLGTAGFSSAGCARFLHHKAPANVTAGVPIDRRPTPIQPDTTPVVVPKTTASPAPTPPPAPAAEPEKPAPQTSNPPAQTPPVEAAMSPEQRKASLARIVADTTAASAAVRKCAGRQLLPDQESVLDTTRNLLSEARTAVAREELWRAESLARKARQLATSLDCR